MESPTPAANRILIRPSPQLPEAVSTPAHSQSDMLRSTGRLQPWLYGRHHADRNQRVFVLRFLIASASLMLVLALFGAGVALGYMPLRPYLIGSGLVAAAILAFLL